MAARTSQLTPMRVSRGRITMLLVFCTLFAALCAARLVHVQVVRHDELSSMAELEVQRVDELLPRRGLIRDSQGNVLAMDIDRESLWVNPRQVKEPEKLSLTLAPLLGMTSDDVYAILSHPKSLHLRLARWLSPEVTAQIKSLNAPGLVFEAEARREYPLGSFAAHVVGVANWDGEGISGVEGFSNQRLKGTSGLLRAERDARTRPLAIGPSSLVPAHDGSDITLTIDPTVQKVIEEELKNGIERNNASGGSIIVLDTQTGAVLGMASWPFFDPNRYQDYSEDVYNRNAAVTDLYEPGSTFKMVNIAAGLDSGAFNVNTTVHDGGSIMRYGWPLSNWNSAGNGAVTPEKVLYYSSNVGALQFAEITGPEKFYDYLRRFGYGEPTGVGLTGEQAGIVQWPEQENWSPLILSSNGFGQSISVTPMQHVRAIAAIGNGGELLQPYIVKEWCQDGICRQTERTVLRRVISTETADLVKPMLVKASMGYAQLIWLEQCGLVDVPLVPGYNVAAKTGTSSIPLNGGYDNSATIGSVAGFAPAENPRFAVLVKVDRPKDIWGVRTAIPIYHSVVSKLLMYYRVPPNPELMADCQRQAIGEQR